MVPAQDTDRVSGTARDLRGLRPLREELVGKRVISLVDSESALGAAVKGYSRKADISDLTAQQDLCLLPSHLDGPTLELAPTRRVARRERAQQERVGLRLA